MRHQLLRDADVMSMAHSVEVRVPFVDSELVTQLLPRRVPAPKGSAPKQLLRDAAATVPSGVRCRRDKQGFTFPFQLWLSGPLRPRLTEFVSVAEQHMREYLLPGGGAAVLAAFDYRRTHWSQPWAIAALCATLPAASSPGA
jgi:asparagine synthase (glutamine-hydrolysing)